MSISAALIKIIENTGVNPQRMTVGRKAYKVSLTILSLNTTLAAYQILLASTTVDLIDKHLKGVAGYHQATEGNNASEGKGNLEQLCLDALDRVVDLDRLPSDGVLGLILPLELGA